MYSLTLCTFIVICTQVVCAMDSDITHYKMQKLLTMHSLYDNLMLQPLAKYFTLADYYVIQFSEQLLLMDNTVEDSEDFTVVFATPTTAQEYTPHTL